MQHAEHQQMERKHILAVNSPPEFLDFVRGLLQDEHFNVTTTNYVPRTFDQIAGLKPDLLLIDLVAGFQAGWDLLEHLQEEALTRGIPVIVTSTDPFLLERAEAQRERFRSTRYIVKPLDIGELLAAVSDLIGSA